MTDLTNPPSTDPTAIYRARDEIYGADMLIAALRGFDFFTWLDSHPSSTLEDVTEQFGFKRRPADVMTTLFAAMGLVVRDGSRLRVSDVAREHLVAGSPWFAGPYFPPLTDRPIARDLVEILKTGDPARFASRPDEDDWHRAMETERFAREFLAAMDCRGRVTAPALAGNLDLGGRQHLLDVGGGSGIFACAFAARHPRLEAAVLEKPPVDAVAARAISDRGYSDRVRTIAGDMLNEPMPGGFDVHLFSNVLHDWDAEVAERLVRASAASLPSGGLLVVHEMFLNADKTGPIEAAAYSVLLMHVTQGRCYSVTEVSNWLSAAGFGRAVLTPTALGRAALAAVKR
jgi:acetylserotonin N-methyltransferase